MIKRIYSVITVFPSVIFAVAALIFLLIMAQQSQPLPHVVWGPYK